MDIINNALGISGFFLFLTIVFYAFMIGCIIVTASSTRKTVNNLYEMEKRQEERHREEMEIKREILDELRRLNAMK